MTIHCFSSYCEGKKSLSSLAQQTDQYKRHRIWVVTMDLLSCNRFLLISKPGSKFSGILTQRNIPELSMMAHAHNSKIQEDCHEFNASLGYLVNYWPTWAIVWGPVSGEKKNRRGERRGGEEERRKEEREKRPGPAKCLSKSGSLSSITKSHVMLEGENQLHKAVLWALHARSTMYVHILDNRRPVSQSRHCRC